MQPGTRIGPYDIVSLLGRGGMGEVWRARDRTLNREVALKVLVPGLAHDVDRLARFEREAQLLASLSHPNIGAIHGVEHRDGVVALVLELVDGPTVADLIARGPLAPDEAFRIAREVAAALEAAHDRGIVHRDLKPANVKLTAGGHVKVLDFGLAKAMDAVHAPAGASLVDTTPVLGTASGVILGTPVYMSPEQAKGQVADRRSDVWSFGCLLYELLTGRRAFDGDSVAEVVTGILTTDVELARLPASAPPAVVALLRRCFERDPKQRLRDIGEARVVLDRPHEAWSIARLEPAGRASGGRTPWLLLGLVAGLAAGTAVAWWLANRVRPSPRTAMHLTLPLAPATRMTGEAFGRPRSTALAISRDGLVVVFAGHGGATDGPMLYRRALGQSVSAPIAGSEGATAVYLSPDGASLAFVGPDGALRTLPSVGGTPTVLGAIGRLGFGGSGRAGAANGAAWGDDGTIVIGSDIGPLWRVRAAGGTPVAITTLPPDAPDYSHRLPHALPGGRGVLYTAVSHPFAWRSRVFVLPSGATAPKLLLENASDARYTASGRLAFLRDGTIMTVPFDLRTLSVSGAVEPSLHDVAHSLGSDQPWNETAAAQFDVSDTGTLVYAAGGPYPKVVNRLLWLSRDGRTEPIGEPGQRLIAPRISPDGRIILVGQHGDTTQPLMMWDTDRRLWAPLVGPNEFAGFFAWAPDGQEFAYGGEGMWLQRVDGSAPPRRITRAGRPRAPSDISRDGRLLAFVESFTPTGTDIWVVPVDGSSPPVPVVRTPGFEAQPVFSPDGHWLAYMSSTAGRLDVFVQAFPGPGPKVQVSSGGTCPVWAPDGRSLYYVGRDAGGVSTLMEASISVTPTLRAGTPRAITPFPYMVTLPARSYDISPDGQRFVVATYDPPKEEPITELQVVVNWFK